MSFQKNIVAAWAMGAMVFSHAALAGCELMLEGTSESWSQQSVFWTHPFDQVSNDELITVYLNGWAVPQKKTKAQILADFPSLNPSTLFLFCDSGAVSPQVIQPTCVEEITKKYLFSLNIPYLTFQDAQTKAASFQVRKWGADIQVDDVKAAVRKSLEQMARSPEPSEQFLVRLHEKKRFIEKAMHILDFFHLIRSDVTDLMGKNRNYFGKLNHVNTENLLRVIRLFDRILRDLKAQALPPGVIQDLESSWIREFHHQTSPTHGTKRTFEEAQISSEISGKDHENRPEKRQRIEESSEVPSSMSSSDQTQTQTQLQSQPHEGELSADDIFEIFGSFQPDWLADESNSFEF